MADEKQTRAGERARIAGYFDRERWTGYIVAALLGAAISYGVPRWVKARFPEVPRPAVLCMGVTGAPTGAEDPRFLLTATYLVQNLGEKETDEMLTRIVTPGRITDLSPEIQLHLVNGGVSENQVTFKLKLHQKQTAGLKVVYGHSLLDSIPPAIEAQGLEKSKFEQKESCF